MAFTHSHINAYVIVGGDSDFITLVEKLKQYDKQIFVVGGRAFTSLVMQRNCHEFIAYENLVGSRRTQDRGRPAAQAAQAPLDQVVPLVRRALKVLSDREVIAAARPAEEHPAPARFDVLGAHLRRRAASATSPRSSRRAGHVVLRESGRNVLVELSENGSATVGRRGTRPDESQPQGIGKSRRGQPP